MDEVKVENFDLEIQYFLHKFLQFRNECKSMDLKLLDRLEDIVDKIEEYLDGTTSFISNESNENSNRCEFNFDNHLIKKYYFCELCQESIKNTKDDVQMHICSEKHKKMNDSLNPSLSKSINIDDTNSLNEDVQKLLSSDIINFLKNKLDVVNNLQQNNGIISNVTQALYQELHVVFPFAKYIPFGSRTILLADKDSNLDIFIDCQQNAYRFGIPKNQIVQNMEAVYKLLVQDKSKWHILNILNDDREPLLRLENRMLNIKCDLFFKNALGYYKSSLLLYYFQNIPMYRRIVLFFKDWFKNMQLFGKQSQFNSYMIYLLILYYLQIRYKTIPIKTTQINTNPVCYGPWQINFNATTFGAFYIHPQLNIIPTLLYDSLISFFEFYGSFDFKNFIISPYIGLFLSKTNIQDRVFQYQHFPRYALFCDVNPKLNSLNLNSSICIQDPIELNVNVSESIDEYNLETFKKGCKYSAQFLKKKLNYR